MAGITVDEIKTYEITLAGAGSDRVYTVEVEGDMAITLCEAQRKQMELYAGWLKEEEEAGVSAEYSRGGFIASRTAFHNVVIALGRIVSSRPADC